MLNGALGVVDMLENGEYGSVARASGFAVGTTVQIAIAKKGFEKCGELADKKKYGAGVGEGSVAIKGYSIFADAMSPEDAARYIANNEVKFYGEFSERASAVGLNNTQIAEAF